LKLSFTTLQSPTKLGWCSALLLLTIQGEP
jgi:hypothetical protein